MNNSIDIVVATALVGLREMSNKGISWDVMFRYLDLEVSKLQDIGQESQAAYLSGEGLDILARTSHV